MQRVQLTRRGFTLIELLVALVLLGLVSAALYRVLVNNQRLYMAQTQRIDLSQNIRAAATILPAEFRELSASEGDIAGPLSATRIAIRAMRWLGFVCSPPLLGGALTGVSMVIRSETPGQPMFFGARGLNITTDSMLIYYDGNQTTRADDFWALGKPVSAPAAEDCLDGEPGQRIIFDLNLLGFPNVPGAITLGAPVRGYERVTYQLYQPVGDTSWYLGLQPAGGTMQPLVGPLLSNGLNFAYFDSTGAVTGIRTRVARIDITVRARTAAAVRQGGGGGPMRATVDSISTSVALRNNRRF
ncbi:MAG: prepilin-type N-terminal cleavage/methylation domain-containing protein [Gemmatimonadales bacterium]